MVPHSVSHLLLDQKNSHLTAARYQRYYSNLVEMPHVTVKRCLTLNPATLLPTESEGEPHDCVAAVNTVCSPRPDLKDTPIPNAEMTLYTDGSAFRDKLLGINQVGYAVCTDHETLASGKLPSHLSAQAAELYALTVACRLATGKTVNIFSDSRYAYGVCHSFGTLWRLRGFKTSAGLPILNGKLVATLLTELLLPKSVSIMHCRAHRKDDSSVTRGNNRADNAARLAAQSTQSSPSLQLVSEAHDPADPSDLRVMQSFASEAEQRKWRDSGCTLSPEGIWYGPTDDRGEEGRGEEGQQREGKPCLTSHLFHAMCIQTHGKDHASKGHMTAAVRQHWFEKGFTAAAESFCKKCIICKQHNSAGAIKITTRGAHKKPQQPFDHIQMDYITLTPCEGKKYCLVIIDMFSKWIEAFPTSSPDTNTVVKALLSHIIPTFGLPGRISSDNGSHFANKALVKLGQVRSLQVK